ncbi:MAG: ABC transporter permease [Bacteroidales bacterium]|nr:ABC transporter permease [Bacteroidales bacterium]
MKNLTIAWRNLWRNKRRTLITAAAVALAVFFSTLMSSMQEGTYSKMIDNIVKFYSGYLQIHHNDYWETRSIDDSYVPGQDLKDALNSTDEIELYVPRIESFTLLSTGNVTKGAALIGIDPEEENKITNLSQWVSTGEYLSKGDKGILVAVNIAKQLKAEIGDTLVLISQGYHGASAAGLFPIKGILKFPSPDLNNFGAYIDLDAARDFFSVPDMVTSMVLLVSDYDHVQKIKHAIQEKVGDKYSIMTWDEMQPEIVQMIEGDRAGGVVMKAILYIVIGFGILGTIIMMMSERKRENGIMIAIGMQKYRLQTMLFYETLLIGLVGVIAGFVLSIPIISIFVNNPIPLPAEIGEAYEMFGLEPAMYFSLVPKVVLNQLITVFVITLCIAVYPVIQIINLKVSNALRA